MPCIATLVLIASCASSQLAGNKPDPLPQTVAAAAGPGALTAPAIASTPQDRPGARPGIGLRAGSLGPLALPPAAGQSKTTIRGCLASGGSEEDGTKFPEPPKTRAIGLPPVTVAVSNLGVTITHELSHACCLRAEVGTAVEAGAVTVAEKLSGKPCRCMCSSTIQTAVGLSPGSYEVAVKLQTAGGSPAEVHREKVEIKRLGQ